MDAVQLTLRVIEHGRYPFYRSFLLLTILALSACSSSEPIEQQAKIAASASRTASLVVAIWSAGAAPSHYASATLQSTADTLAEAGRQIKSDNSPETPERRGVMAAVGQLTAGARRAQAGVAVGNPRQVSEGLEELEAAATDLAAARARYVAPKS
ncbi:hypothetical protein [Mesorhizobium sp. 128a]